MQNLRKEVGKILTEARHIEGSYVERVKNGSSEMEDYLELSYYSGLRNGIAFMKHIIENPEDIEIMKKEIFRQKVVN